MPVLVGGVLGFVLAGLVVYLQRPADYVEQCRKIAEQVWLLEVMDGHDPVPDPCVVSPGAY